jgi:hypothetical protein
MIDDRTAAYIVDTRKPFEDLRQVTSQLAGLLVLTASGARSAGPEQLMLGPARELLARAADQIRCARPSERSREHHGHLLEAVAAIDTALRAASRPLTGGQFDGIDAVLTPLRDGYGRLQAAAEGLPGFELVAVEQACCVHGVPRDTEQAARKHDSFV